MRLRKGHGARRLVLVFLLSTTTTTLLHARSTDESTVDPRATGAASALSRGEYSDCTPDTTVLVFDGGYRVSMCYETAEGTIGDAQGGIWASAQSGLLWFFDRDNAEVLVKVLDGCSQNGRRWVFVAPVTDVAFNLHVTSSRGREWMHRNPLGQTATTRSDTSAFVCATDDGTPDDGTPDDGTHVDIPDAGLRSAIETELGLPRGAPITRDRLESLTRLMAQEAGIRNLRGLEQATNLTLLNLRGNEIADVSSLAGLINLTWLNLAVNEISDVSPLAGLTQLNTLDLSYNGEARGTPGIPDLSPLAGLARLRFLYLDFNRIADISPLAALTNLNVLFLQANEIADLSPLAGLTSLTELHLSANAVGDVSQLAGLTNLSWLGLAQADVSDISPLAGLTNLNWLRLDLNRISDVSPLAGLIALNELNLAGNSISDISPLAGLIALNELNLEWNLISDASPLAGLTNLATLNLRGNPLDTASLNAHVPALVNRGVDVLFDRFTKRDFDIELVFLGSAWSTGSGRIHRQRVEWAARRWMAVVTDDLADHVLGQARSGTCGESSWEISEGERIDDLRVHVAALEGRPGDPVGYGGPNLFRDNGFPISGCMVLDLERGNIPVLASHELAHVLGFGTLSTWDALVRTSGDLHFSGPLATEAFDDAGGSRYGGAKVPLADSSHWRVPVLEGEVMGPQGGHALSAITVQALADLGYGVDVTQADEYALPDVATATSESSAHGAAEATLCSVRGAGKPIPVVDR